jgi:branched-chain amino acid transport system ATP-binding protein
MLKVENLTVRYDAIVALDGVSMEARRGQIVAVLGANGAGKSSLLRAIAGVGPAAAGRVMLGAADITGASPSDRVRAGISLVPEGRRILITMTVEENLLLGAYARSGDLAEDLARVYTRFPNLERRRSMSASVLSGGEQQMLAIGRALMARPSLLLLDEPSLGLSPLLQTEMFNVIRELNAGGTTILLVEQNVHKTLACAHQVYVLELGRLIAADTPERIRNQDVLHRAYLGATTATT